MDRYLLLFGIPLIANFFLFPIPPTVNVLPQTNQHILVHPAQDQKYFLRALLNQFMDTTLNLGIYNFCVKNNGFLEINGEPVTKAEGEESPDKIGFAKVEIGNPELDSTSTFLVAPGDNECQTIIVDSDVFNLNLTPAGGVVMEGPAYMETHFAPNPDVNQPVYLSSIDFDQVKVSFYRNPWAIAIEWIAIFIFWDGIVILGNEIRKFLRKTD